MAERMIISRKESEPQRIFARSDMRSSAWRALWGTCACLALLFCALIFTLVRPKWIAAYTPLEIFHAEEIETSVEKSQVKPPPRKTKLSALPNIIPLPTTQEELIIKMPEIPPIPEIAQTEEVFLDEYEIQVPEITEKANKKTSDAPPKKRKPQKNLVSNTNQSSAQSNTPAAPSQLARPKRTPFPPYPRDARDAKEEGTVILRISLNPQGEPVNVSIAQSSGFQSLDLAAQKWVRHNWVFYPAMSNDIATSCTMMQRLRFVLN